MTGARIRAGEERDLEALTEIYNHYVRHTHITFDIEPWRVEARRARWFSHYGEDGPHRLRVAVEGEAVLGYVTSSPMGEKAGYRTTIETSVYLRPEASGRGLGTRLYEALFQALSGLDLHRAYAGIALPNPGSMRLHEKLGFRQVGVFSEVGRKFGRFYDVAWYERSLVSGGVAKDDDGRER